MQSVTRPPIYSKFRRDWQLASRLNGGIWAWSKRQVVLCWPWIISTSLWGYVTYKYLCPVPTEKDYETSAYLKRKRWLERKAAEKQAEKEKHHS